MPSAGLEPATPALGRRRSGPLSYEGMLPAARLAEVIIDIRQSGRSSARLERSVRDREAESSNLFAPTPFHVPAMTGRAFFAMLIFVGFVVAVMWFAVLPALTTFRPTLP